MDKFTNFIFFIDENGYIIKYHPDVEPFCWVYVNPVGEEYEEYLRWVEEGNQAKNIVGIPTGPESFEV